MGDEVLLQQRAFMELVQHHSTAVRCIADTCGTQVVLLSLRTIRKRRSDSCKISDSLNRAV